MKSVVLVSVLLTASAAVLAAPAAPEPQPYGGDLIESAAPVTTSTESASSSQVTGNRDKKSAPCDESFKSTASSSSSSTATQNSDMSQDPSLQERTKGVKLVPIEVPVTKTKFVKVPVQQHDMYSHGGHYAYGGHRANEWSQQNFGSANQERFDYANSPDFQAFQRASQQQMAAAMQAEMAARAEVQARMEEFQLAKERQEAITAREQALASEQQLAAATMQAEMAAMAQARAAELAQQEKILQDQELALAEARRMHIELAEKKAMESAQQISQDTSARSAYAASYSPQSVSSGGGAASVGYFPHTPVTNNCGGIPLLFGCSPTLVRGNLVGGYGFSSGGGGAYSASGFGYGSGSLGGGSLGYGGGYRQAGDSENSNKLVIDLDKMTIQQRALLQKLMAEYQGQFNALNSQG